MPRIARVVIPQCPHHITQRGNRRQQVFFSDDDYNTYLTLLDAWSKKAGLSIWAFCLMPNHVHIIAVPQREDSIHGALKEPHRRYSTRVNQREGWRGYLWQGRFASFPLDVPHAWHALRYVENNPVKAGLAARKEDWPWSSAAIRTNPGDERAGILSPLPEGLVRSEEPDCPDGFVDALALHEKTGRPLGSATFIDRLEALCNRPLRPQKRGPKT